MLHRRSCSHGHHSPVKNALALLAIAIVACTGQIGGRDGTTPPPSGPAPEARYAMPPTPTTPGPVFAEATETPLAVAAAPAITPEPQPTPTPAPPQVPSPTATSTLSTPPPTPTPARLVTPPAVEPTPLPPAISYTIPLRSLAEARDLGERPAAAELLQAARRYPKSRIYLTAYVEEADAQQRGSDVQSVSNELVIQMAQYLASRGIDATRISGKGMGANPNVGRAIVVSLDVVGAEAPDVSARTLAEREAAVVAPDRFPRQNTAFKEIAGSPAYRVGRGDEVLVTIWYASGPQEFRSRVSPTGTVTFDLVDEAPIAGLTLQEAKSLLVNVLRRFIRNPRLTIAVSQYASRSVTVMSPDGPQAVLLDGRTTVLDLLAREKIAPATADLKNVRVVRGEQEFSVNLFRTILDRDWKQNLVLDDGDVVYLPTFNEAGSYVAVLGAVTTPGLYPIRTRVTAVDALFAAGGATTGAYLPHARIIRGDPERPQLLPADVDLVLNKGRLDAHRELSGGDVLYVPSTRISNWNKFVSDLRPTLALATLPFQSFGAAFLFGRGDRDVTTTTNIVIFPTPGAPLP